MKKTIKPSDLNYKILQGLDRSIFTESKQATLIVDGDSYSVKIDAKNKRLTGMGSVYLDHDIHEGDIVELEYNDQLSTIRMERQGMSLLMNGGQDNNLKEDVGEFREVEVAVESLGIPDPETWRDDPGVYKIPADNSWLRGCANKDYVLFCSEVGRLVLFCRADQSARIITPGDLIWHTGKKETGDTFSISCMAITDNALDQKVFFAIGRTIFEWNVNGREVNEHASVKAPQYVSSMACWGDDLYYTTGANSETIWIYGDTIHNHESMFRKIGRGVGIYGIYCGVDEQGSYTQILLNSWWKEEPKIYDTRMQKIYGVEEYIKSLMPEADIGYMEVEAINLAKETVALFKREHLDSSDDPRPKDVWIRDGWKGKETGTAVYVSQGNLRKEIITRDDMGQLGFAKNFQDVYGHYVANVGVYDYHFAYRSPDGTSRLLIETFGGLRPESFQFVDSHTALVKVHERGYAICDFMKNMKYTITA